MEKCLGTAGRPECDPFLPALLCSSNPVSGQAAAAVRVHAIVTSPCSSKKKWNRTRKKMRPPGSRTGAVGSGVGEYSRRGSERVGSRNQNRITNQLFG